MKTIITACFKQETNRYAPGVTGMDDFRRRNARFGAEAIPDLSSGEKNEWTAFYQYFADKQDYCLVPVAMLNASPGPVVAQDVWQQVMDSLLQEIAAQPKVDGVLLALHGAMVTETFEDAEGEMLQRLRKAVGPGVPIMASLDLHVNMTQKMMDNADALFAYDYYPHTDSYETAIRAADCLYKTVEGDVRPVMRWNKLDMIMPYMPTAHPVFAPILAHAQALREGEKMLGISLCHGFFPADIYEQGAAAVVITDDDGELAQMTADALGETIFAARKQLTRSYLSAQEAVQIALGSERFPVVIADTADNPGAGASSDSTLLLKVLIENNAQDVAFASMYDPETVALAEKAGVGSTIAVELGGKVAPEVTGGPVVCTAYVKAITDGIYRNRDKMSHGVKMRLGKSALLQIGGIQVVVTSSRTQSWDLEVYRHFGIQPEDMKILVIKSTIHFRASFSKVAAEILDVEAPALALQDPLSYPLSHSRRPIYPLDEI